MRYLACVLVGTLALALLSTPARADTPPVAERPAAACPATAAGSALVLAASEPGSTEIVCCLIDAPEGCTGCGQGASCVYEKIEEHQCVYVIYGTKCEDASLCK